MTKAKPGHKLKSDEYIDQIAKLEAISKRALADYQNLEKRTQAEKQQFVRLATFGLISQLLPIIDGLERAQTHLKDPGLEIIYKQLIDILKNEGLTEIEALNKPFEPQIMECTEQVAGPANQVVRVDNKGYRLNDIVIRPAKVAVGNNS